MQTPQQARTSRGLVWAALAVGLLALLYFFPLFHVVPLEAARTESAAGVFDASAFVAGFWEDRLLTAAEDAVDAGEMIAALQADRAEAARRFGHKLGLSGDSSYFVAGSGRIVSVEDDAVTIALDDEGAATIVIETGPLFGNAIRDGSGLLDVSDFANSQDFNAISSEINRRVEERVFPLLREKAAVGAAVRFAGGVEMAETDPQSSPLKLAPVMVEFP